MRTVAGFVGHVASGSPTLPPPLLEMLAGAAELAGVDVDRELLFAGTLSAGAYALTLAARLEEIATAAADDRALEAQKGPNR